MQETKSGIYGIRNIINNKIYIGSAINFLKRKNQHYSKLKFNKHKNNHLQNSYNKYGKENFVFEIIELVEDFELLLIKENYWINFLRTNDFRYGYNIRKEASNNLGIKHSYETKQKMSLARIGKYSGKNHPMYGKHPSAESKKKMSDSQKGRISPNLGKHPSDETKQKLSIALSGKNNPNYGKHHSEETKRKISQSRCGKNTGINNYNFGRKMSEEQKAKLSKKKMLKKETVLKIKKMIDDNIPMKDISKIVGVNKNIPYKVKNGGYKDIYGI